MTEGTQPQEVQENTKDSTEVREQPREVSESREELDRATHQPEEVVEREGDFQEAEKVETAFKEVVQAVEATADGGPGTEDGVEAAQAAADGRPETEVRSAQEQGGGGEGETGSEAPAATEDRAVETSAPAESAGDNPPPPEAPDPVEPMFPASAKGGGVVTPGSIDVTKLPAEDSREGEPSISPVQDVSGASSAPAEDHSAVMGGTQPAEVSGYEVDEDGNQTYALRGDGQTGTETIPDRIEDAEAAREAPNESAAAPTRQESQGASSPADVDREGAAEVQRGDDPQGEAAPSLEAEKPGEVTSAAGAKAIGGTAPEASGLPVDEGSRDEMGYLDQDDQQEELENKVDSQAENYVGETEGGIWEMTGDGSTSTSSLDEIIENRQTVGEQFQTPDSEAGEASDAASDQPDSPKREDFDSDEAYNAAVEKYNASLEDTESQAEGIDEQLAAILESIRLSINALLAKGEQLKQRREELHTIRSNIQDLGSEIGMAVDLIREVREENSVLADQLTDLESGETVLITIHTGSDPGSGNYSWTEKTQEMDRDMIENHISKNEDLISSLESRIVALEEEINMQTSNLEGKQNEIEKLLNDIQKLSDKIQALQQQAAIIAETLGQSYTPRKIPVVANASSGDVSLSSSRQVTGSGGPSPAAGGLPLDD